jgi:hypothetical protein
MTTLMNRNLQMNKSPTELSHELLKILRKFQKQEGMSYYALTLIHMDSGERLDLCSLPNKDTNNVLANFLVDGLHELEKTLTESDVTLAEGNTQ